MNLDAVKKNVRVALKEDSVRQDLSIKAITKFSKKIVSAELIIREKAIISGKAWLEESFKQIDPAIKISWRFKEGKEVPKNSIVAKITGNPKAILSAERTALNFLQFMSGISTKTAKGTTSQTIQNSCLFSTWSSCVGVWDSNLFVWVYASQRSFVWEPNLTIVGVRLGHKHLWCNTNSYDNPRSSHSNSIRKTQHTKLPFG